ncbi:hypothetical protein AN958_02097 [Leucoagaricus sp. SymC.cos]|nr:hypothetical protein AN958_02097 [Leucoagaricus sp. SymC.cos]
MNPTKHGSPKISGAVVSWFHRDRMVGRRIRGLVRRMMTDGMGWFLLFQEKLDAPESVPDGTTETISSGPNLDPVDSRPQIPVLWDRIRPSLSKGTESVL